MFSYFLLFIILKYLKIIFVKNSSQLNNCLLLIAHPDDESMFFTPFLYHNKPFVLCLSDGNFYKQGKQRKLEMENLCTFRKLKSKILNYQDNEDWDFLKISQDLLNVMIEFNINEIVTFDKHGISGHKNHISCHKAVSYLHNLAEICNEDQNYLQVYFLKSKNLIQKYGIDLSTPEIFFSTSLFDISGITNMLFHKSQLTYYRILYIVFSNYMIYNDFLTL